jgi:hypothetical protein
MGLSENRLPKKTMMIDSDWSSIAPIDIAVTWGKPHFQTLQGIASCPAVHLGQPPAIHRNLQMPTDLETQSKRPVDG